MAAFLAFGCSQGLIEDPTPARDRLPLEEPQNNPAAVTPNPRTTDSPSKRVEQREPARRPRPTPTPTPKPNTGTVGGSNPMGMTGSTPKPPTGGTPPAPGTPPAESPPDGYTPPSTPPPPIGMGPVKPHPRILLDQTTLGTLRTRSQGGDAAWTRLLSECRRYASGTVEWPDGAKYPPSGIGEGYQGSGYIDPVFALGLCFQVHRMANQAEASSFARKGAEVLTKMSEPSGSHAMDPLRDSGYGIRFYGVTMAIGFDWLYDELSPELRARVVAALTRWISAFDRGGFSRNHPQGNYFAGYYAAKGLAALGTEGDNADAAALWQDFYGRLHGQMVQPYYAKALSGGGWPEGWNYGPRSVFNLWLPALAAQTAKDLDLVGGSRPFTFLVGSGTYLMHFAWPSRLTLDDRGLQYAAANPSDTDPFLYTSMAAFLERSNDPAAPVFHRFARSVRDRQGGAGSVETWAEFLFWNAQAPERDVETLPLSHYAPGMEMVAMRSDWSDQAVWGAFAAGPYTNNPDSAEQFWDEGGLSIVRGSTPFLVNATAALVRTRNGVADGDQYGERIYDEMHGGSRTLFNVFYANAPSPYGQDSYGPDNAQTRVDRHGEADTYAYARGVRIEDLYRRSQAGRAVTKFARQVLFVRPATFVVFDETAIGSGVTDQWLAFHFPFRPENPNATRTMNVGTGNTFVGAVTPVHPIASTARIVNVFDSNKVFRLEIHAPVASASVEWLTVLEAASSAGSVAPATALTVELGKGVLLGQAKAVVFATGAPASGAPLHYQAPASVTQHIVAGLVPGTSYTVTKTSDGVSIAPGDGPSASAAGVLTFN